MSKIVLMSDSHGDYEGVDSIVKEHCASADAFIHLGDGIEEFLQAMQKYMVDCYYCVPGNNDWRIFSQSGEDHCVININGRRILLTHGHKYHVRLDRLGVAHMAALEKADLVLYGHTHIAMDETIKGIRIINPGSLRYSRSGAPSYAVVEFDEDAVQYTILKKDTY